MRTLLMMAPYFAPQAAVGAYRSVKLARHLPAQGYRPVVLSGTFESDARDEALLGALPDAVIVRDAYLAPAIARLQTKRARAPKVATNKPLTGLDPFHGGFDRYAIHALHAARTALKLGRTQDAALVYASLGPYSMAPVALLVARLLGVPVVLDLRDPWALHETGESVALESARVRLTAAVVRQAEQSVLARASHVVLNTERALAAYRAEYPWIEAKSSCIRNGFDRGLYRTVDKVGPRSASRFRVLHFGTLRADTPIDDIAAGLRLLIDRERLDPSTIELSQVGHIGEHERRVIDRLGLSPFFREEPRVAYGDGLTVMRGAHLLVVANTPVVRMRVSAKTYDYVASGMPIFTGRNDHARVACGDAEGVARVLAEHFAKWRASGALPSPAEPPAELSSEAGAARLAAIFDALLSAGGSAPSAG